MTAPRRIAAVGGGGFLTEDWSLRQERWLLSLVRQQTRPKVLWLGTASGDAASAQLKFYRAFSELEGLPSVLTFFPYEMDRDYHQAVLDADLIYVGGGNTVAMLAVWREFDFVRSLRAAYERGTVITGISAGANCWFERYVTDSVPGGGVRQGLGWLRGCFCPHLDGEAWRQDVLKAEGAPAVGAGDGVVVLFENEAWTDAVSTAKTQSLLWRRLAEGAELQNCEPRALI